MGHDFLFKQAVKPSGHMSLKGCHHSEKQKKYRTAASQNVLSASSKPTCKVIQSSIERLLEN